MQVISHFENVWPCVPEKITLEIGGASFTKQKLITGLPVIHLDSGWAGVPFQVQPSFMGPVETHTFGFDPVTAHAWNSDRSVVAISPNNSELHLYQKRGSQWNKESVLTEHTQRITSIDWAPKSNRIVTCGADRNAYVWTLNGKEWKPTLVILRFNRAATCVKWSPKENKFAVGSGAKSIAVCYFEEDNDWWVSKNIKKPIRSTVSTLDWHPNNLLLASGSCDFKVRIHSAFVKDVEPKPTERLPFGNMLKEYSNGTAKQVVSGGWVHVVQFSPSGCKLAWIGHDSSISVADISSNEITATIRTTYLPFMSLLWANESRLIVAGHDCFPLMYEQTGDTIRLLGKLDKEKSKENGEESKISAMQRFQSLDKNAMAESEDLELGSVHQNTILVASSVFRRMDRYGSADLEDEVVSSTHSRTITQLCPYQSSGDQVSKFSSCGVDGQMVVWDLQSIASSMKGLKIS